MIQPRYVAVYSVLRHAQPINFKFHFKVETLKFYFGCKWPLPFQQTVRALCSSSICSLLKPAQRMKILAINLEQVVAPCKWQGFLVLFCFLSFGYFFSIWLFLFYFVFWHGTMRSSPLTTFQFYPYIFTSAPIVIMFEYLRHNQCKEQHLVHKQT